MATRGAQDKEHITCKLISAEENRVLQSSVNSRCYIMACTVARLYMAEASRYIKKFTGLITYEKDNAMKSYYLRMYEFADGGGGGGAITGPGRLVWSQEVYSPMKLKLGMRTVEFDGDEKPCLLSFVDQTEFDAVLNRIRNRLDFLQRPKQQTQQQQPQPVGGPGPMGGGMGAIRNIDRGGGAGMLGAGAQIGDIPKGDYKRDKDKVDFTNKAPKKRINKADISQPTQFEHLGHLGLDSESFGMDTQFSDMLSQAGIFLKNDADKQYMMQKVNEMGGIEKFKQETQKLQQQQQHHGGGGPPPPAYKTGVAPPPPRMPPPKRPVTGSMTRGVAMGGDLQSQIQGFNKSALKKVDPNEKPRPPPASAKGGAPLSMMDMLKQAMEERNIREAMEDSDEDEEDSDNEFSD